jgi:hypothetical protein
MTGRQRRERRHLLAFLAGGCILFSVLMLSGSEWFWANLPLMQYMEFPWRMLAPACFCLALLTAAAGPATAAFKVGRNLAMAAALGLLILPSLPHIAPAGYQPIDLRQWTPQQIARRGISVTTRNEYAPMGSEAPPYRGESVRTVAGSAQGGLHRHSPEYWSGQMDAAAESTIEISCFFFPGWLARIDGAAIPIEPSPGTGLIRITVPKGRHRIELLFTHTLVRRAAESISTVSALVLVGLWWWTRRKSPAVTRREFSAVQA